MNKLSSSQMRHHSQMSHQRLNSRMNSHQNLSNIGTAFQTELAKDMTENMEK